MPFDITVSDVRDGYATGSSDASLELCIAIADQADACLTSNSVPDAIGRKLKILAVQHMDTNQRDGGSVTSERAVSGASRSFEAYDAGETGYLDTLRQLDRWGCVYSVVSSNSGFSLMSIGRRPERNSTY